MGLPYSKFFWGDYLNATRILSMEAKGAWMDVLCYLADSDTPGQVGYTLQSWSRLLGCSKCRLKKLFSEISAAKVGTFSEKNGKIFIKNNRICDDFADYIEKKSSNSEAGKKSAKIRRKLKEINETASTTVVTTVVTDVVTDVDQPLERNVNNPTNETSTIPEARSQKLESLSLKEKKPNGSERENSFAEIPTWDEVWDHAQIRGILRETAESFFNWHQDNDYWLNRFGKPINWKSKLQNWKVKGQTFQANGKAPKRQKMTSAELLERIKDVD
jgi:uncharacterized protein YdaU (DUF1376 family)